MNNNLKQAQRQYDNMDDPRYDNCEAQESFIKDKNLDDIYDFFNDASKFVWDYVIDWEEMDKALFNEYCECNENLDAYEGEFTDDELWDFLYESTTNIWEWLDQEKVEGAMFEKHENDPFKDFNG